jgi:hypothetical protein
MQPLVDAKVQVNFALLDCINRDRDLFGSKPSTVAMATSSRAAQRRSSGIVVPTKIS